MWYINSMIINEINANNPAYVHILVNGKNVGTRNNVVAVIYENNASPEEILHVKEAYSVSGYIVAVKCSNGTMMS